MGAFEDGQAFINGVLAKLPESLRATAKAAFEDAAAKDAVTLVGDSVLARADYSKNMDALKKQEADLKKQTEDRLTQLNDWYATNEAALKEYPTLKAKAGKVADDDDLDDKSRKDPPVDPRKVAQEVLNEAGPEYIGVSAWLAAKAVEHFQTFGQPADVMGIVQNPKLGKPVAGQPGRVFSLNDAYMEKYGEQVAAKQKETTDKAFETEVQKRMAEEKAKFKDHPFPLRGEISPSALDVLATKDGPAAHTLDTAVAEYERLQTTRGV